MYEELNRRRRASVEKGSLMRANFEEITKDPMSEQERLLLALLSENKDTEYGRRYGFEGISSIREFQERVPITEYGDYEPYIERMANLGERNLLCIDPPAWYSKTSGTVGAPKKIPTTQRARELNEGYIVDYRAALLFEELGEGYFGGRPLNLARCGDTVQVMPDGVAFGPVSEGTKRRFYERQKDKWNLFYAAPAEATFAGKDTDSRYLYALYSLRDEGLMCIESTFSSFILDFCRFIEKMWETLVADIEAGTIAEDVRLPDDVRETLTEALEPMPERAARLREVFERGFDRPFMPLVWPDLAYVSASASGGFRRYTREIHSRYLGEDVLFIFAGIIASEGTLSVPVAPADFSSCLVPDVLFYEFLPVEEDEEEAEHGAGAGADTTTPLTMDQLEPGQAYELIITNRSGLYRYRMKDVVLVTGTHHGTPMVEFQYRTDKTVSLMGEKTTEAALRFAEEKTARECGFLLVDCAVYPDTEENRYVFIMEIDEVPEDLTEQQILTRLEENLAEANPSLGDKLDKGIINRTKILFAQPETFVLYRDVMLMKGASVTQLKPVTVIGNEFQRKYFFSLTDSFEEIREAAEG